MVTMRMLEGESINLRLAGKKDVSLIAEWWSDRGYMGEYQDVMTISERTLEEIMLHGTIFFMIERKDGTKIGHISSWTRGKTREMGYALVPSERGKGYGTEAIQMMVDYLFLKEDIIRIQAPTETANIPSKRALEKAGFVAEGVMRRSHFVRGVYRDAYLYSILREEWKTPRILKSVLKTHKSDWDKTSSA